MNKYESTFVAVEQYILAAVLIILSGALVFSGLPDRLNYILYDTAIRLSPIEPSPDIAIIAIDEKSLDQFGQWPWRRQYHSELITHLNKAGAARIAFDIIFAESDADHPEDDQQLAEAISAHGSVFLPVHIHPRSSGSTLSEVLPIPDLVAVAKGLGHIHIELDNDGIARGLFLKEGIGSPFWPSLSYALAMDSIEHFKSPVAINTEQVSAFVNVRTGYITIPFVGSGGSFPTYSYADVLDGKIDNQYFRGKTVLVGATAAGLGDVLPTPVSGLASPMPGVELHANAYSALVQNETIKPLSYTWVYLLTFAFVLIPVLVFPRVPPEQTLPALVLLISMVFAFSYGVLYLDRSWFPPAATILCIIVAYPLWSWQRLRQLYRFLNDELERLHREPSLTQTDLNQRNLDKTLPELARLLGAKGYLLQEDGQTLKSLNAQAFVAPSQLRDWHWYHDTYTSWLQFSKKRRTYLFAIYWSDQNDVDKKRAYLHRLHLGEANVPDEPRRSHERLALRIAQVQRAISRMQDMRYFIADGFENMPDGVIVTDAMGTILFANSHAGRWIGAEKEKLQNQSITRLLTSIYPHAENWEQVLYRVLVDLEDVIVEANHQEQDLLLHFSPSLTVSAAGTGVIVNLSDITSIKKGQREREELISFLSHDVRSPLVSQLALINRLQQQASQQQSLSTESFDDLSAYAQRSLDLAEQFLQVNRAEHLSENNFYECDLISIIENSMDNLSPMAQQKHINIELYESGGDLWIYGNADLLERAFTNIISNAIKYSPENTQITINVLSKDKQATIVFTDEGIGIDSEAIPHLFKRFYRQKKTESDGSMGSGLGLNFTDIVISKHKGHIEVESQVDRGTSFSVTLPVLPSEPT